MKKELSSTVRTLARSIQMAAMLAVASNLRLAQSGHTSSSVATPVEDALRETYEALLERLAAKNGPPTIEEMEELYHLGEQLPLPDFSSRFNAERERNSSEYQEEMRKAREQAGEMVGLGGSYRK